MSWYNEEPSEPFKLSYIFLIPIYLYNLPYFILSGFCFIFFESSIRYFTFKRRNIYKEIDIQDRIKDIFDEDFNNDSDTEKVKELKVLFDKLLSLDHQEPSFWNQVVNWSMLSIFSTGVYTILRYIAIYFF